MDDLRSSVKNQRSVLEKIMGYIPLYHGYKTKELRRESDKILRNYIHQILNDTRSNLKKSQTLLMEKNKISDSKKIDKLLTSCDTASQKINHAEAGYSGFWDATKIKEKDLDNLYEIDEKIAKVSEDTKSSSLDIINQVGVQEEIKFENMEQNIMNLEKCVQDRKNFLGRFGE